MEKMTQRYIKYFYIILISIISIQLLGTVIETLVSGLRCGALISITLFLINIILLAGSIKHNSRQQFTECKEDARILRFTLGLLAISRMITCSLVEFNWVEVTDYLMILGVIELILDYRIRSIENLETMAKQVARTRSLDEEGG